MRIYSVLPFSLVLILLSTFSSTIALINGSAYAISFFFFNIFVFVTCMYLWFNNLILESTYLGLYTHHVRSAILKGFCVFVATEVMLFFSFFWINYSTFIDSSATIGFTWPPTFLFEFLPGHISFAAIMNVLLLGSSLLLALYPVRKNDFLLMSVLIVGMLFSVTQFIEYKNLPGDISNSLFFASFYLITGLHGTHVFVGICMLAISCLRNKLTTLESSTGTIISIYYWHLVDIIWILVYLTQYVHMVVSSFDYTFFSDTCFYV